MSGFVLNPDAVFSPHPLKTIHSCHGNLPAAHPPTLCCHQDLWEASRVKKTHSQLSPCPKRSLDQVGYRGERANHCSRQKELERMGGIRVGRLGLGSCKPVRDPTARDRDHGERPGRNWEDLDEKWLLQSRNPLITCLKQVWNQGSACKDTLGMGRAVNNPLTHSLLSNLLPFHLSWCVFHLTFRVGLLFSKGELWADPFQSSGQLWICVPAAWSRQRCPCGSLVLLLHHFSKPLAVTSKKKLVLEHPSLSPQEKSSSV